jgi:hypothetical protein
MGQKYSKAPFIFDLRHPFVDWWRGFIAIQVYNGDRFLFRLVLQEQRRRSA